MLNCGAAAPEPIINVVSNKQLAPFLTLTLYDPLESEVKESEDTNGLPLIENKYGGLAPFILNLIFPLIKPQLVESTLMFVISFLIFDT